MGDLKDLPTNYTFRLVIDNSVAHPDGRVELDGSLGETMGRLEAWMADRKERGKAEIQRLRPIEKRPGYPNFTCVVIANVAHPFFNT